MSRRKNGTVIINRIRSAADGESIEVEKGCYVFSEKGTCQRNYPISNTYERPLRQVHIPMEKKKNLVIDFGGSELLFEGWSMPFALDECENVTLKNFSVDWGNPPGAEAEVMEAAPGEFVLKIDGEQYPHFVKDGKLYFTGDGFANECWELFEFDGNSLLARGETADQFWEMTFEQDGNFIKVKGDFAILPTVGNRMVLRHGKRDHAGIFCQHSKNLIFENVKIYSCCGIAFVCQFCENLTFYNVAVIPNAERGRQVLSGHDDGIQCSNCKGTVRFFGCSFRGLMDDAINVHGTSTCITKINNNRITGMFMENCSKAFPHYATKGDSIHFIDRKTLNVIGKSKVKDYRLLDEKNFEITVESPVPEGINEGDAMENITNTPEVVCENCRFDSGRARGLLIATPKKVKIRHNTFCTSGSAILASGDANGWFESGACKEVVIENNDFSSHCLSGRYDFGKAVISFYPVIPNPAQSNGFHENITIRDNTFAWSGRRLLYALCTAGIEFTNNLIEQASGVDADSFTEFEHCQRVDTAHNTIC